MRKEDSSIVQPPMLRGVTSRHAIQGAENGFWREC